MSAGEPPLDMSGIGFDDEPTSIASAADVGGFFGGRFRIDQRLGSGAMGKVLSALDTQTGQVVALKILHRDRSKDPAVLRRFAREARALSAIAHPAIVGIVASGRAPDGTPWLAMEHLVGRTLKDRIRAGGPMSVEELWPIIKTVAEAMAVAHAAGVVHRDLKPENVLLPERPPPAAKILDFGLSSLSAENDRLTKTGEVLGTPRYMAPELLVSSKKPDQRVDVFALGVIAFEALTGQSMYTADDLGSLFGQILEGRVRPLRLLRPDLSDTMEGLIQQATARDQDERFGTVTAFVTAFGHAAGYRDGPVVPPPSALAALFDDLTAAEAESAPLLDPFSGAALPAKKPSSIPVRSRAPTAFGVAPAAAPPRLSPAPAPPGAQVAGASPRPVLAPARAPAMSDTRFDPQSGPAAWGHGPTPSSPVSRPAAVKPPAGPGGSLASTPAIPASRPRAMTPPPQAVLPVAGPAPAPAPAQGAPAAAPYPWGGAAPAVPRFAPGPGAPAAQPWSARPAPAAAPGPAPAFAPGPAPAFAAPAAMAGAAAAPPASFSAPSPGASWGGPAPHGAAPANVGFSSPGGIRSPAPHAAPPANVGFSSPASAPSRAPGPAPSAAPASVPVPPLPRPAWHFWALFGVAALVVMALASAGALALRWLLSTGRL